MLGLQDVANTVVGDSMLRGISGGQRKRVTTAEILAGPQSLVLMDEISTGLDRWAGGWAGGRDRECSCW